MACSCLRIFKLFKKNERILIHQKTLFRAYFLLLTLAHRKMPGSYSVKGMFKHFNQQFVNFSYDVIVFQWKSVL